jgi:hypothetical protein
MKPSKMPVIYNFREGIEIYKFDHPKHRFPGWKFQPFHRISDPGNGKIWEVADLSIKLDGEPPHFGTFDSQRLDRIMKLSKGKTERTEYRYVNPPRH